VTANFFGVRRTAPVDDMWLSPEGETMIRNPIDDMLLSVMAGVLFAILKV
jgi:hypothetical protein